MSDKIQDPPTPCLNGKCGILKYHHNHFKFPFSNLLQSSTLTPTRLTIIHLHVMFPKIFCGSRLFPRFNFLRNTKRRNKTFLMEKPGVHSISSNLKSANKNKDKLKMIEVLCELILSVNKYLCIFIRDKKKNKILQMESFLLFPAFFLFPCFFFLPRVFSSSKIRFLKDIHRGDKHNIGSEIKKRGEYNQRWV